MSPKISFTPSPFHQLSYPALINLAIALESQRLVFPFSPLIISIYVPHYLCSLVTKELQKLSAMGMKEIQIAYTLRLLAEERMSAQKLKDNIELVWTGNDFLGSESRDTCIAVRELFATASKNVMVVSYVVDDKPTTRDTFKVLGDRMKQVPELKVELFFNIQRPHLNKISEAVLIQQFRERFFQHIWQGELFPDIYYYRKAIAQYDLAITEDSVSSSTIINVLKSCLHAKCVVVDMTKVLITSANFTEAAHERNIEIGLLLDNPLIATSIVNQFKSLAEQNVFAKIVT